MRQVASCAKQTLIPWSKTEPPNAPPVQVVVLQQKGVPNVPIAHRANLKTKSTTKKFVPIAPLALHKVTRTKTVVRNVSKEKKHQREEVVFVHLAIWVHSI